MMDDQQQFGESRDMTKMYGGVLILLASWGAGGNMLLCALLYQNNLWTLINRAMMSVSFLSIFQAVFCMLPVGVGGANMSWSFGTSWCDAYPFLYTFSQMTMIYLMILLLVYNIYSLWDEKRSDRLKTSTFWLPPLLFFIPYLIFLAPSIMFLKSDHITTIKEDRAAMYACTVVPIVPDRTDYRAYNGMETILGFLVPYLGVVVLFLYLIALIRKRKANKISVNDLINAESPDLTNLTETETKLGNTAEPELPLPLPVISPEYNRKPSSPSVLSHAARSDKSTEVVVLVLVATLILSYLPMLYLKLKEVFEAGSSSSSSSDNIRWIALMVSYAVAVINPTIYTLQYPTIRESIVKLDMIRSGK